MGRMIFVVAVLFMAVAVVATDDIGEPLPLPVPREEVRDLPREEDAWDFVCTLRPGTIQRIVTSVSVNEKTGFSIVVLRRDGATVSEEALFPADEVPLVGTHVSLSRKSPRSGPGVGHMFTVVQSARHAQKGDANAGLSAGAGSASGE